MTDLDADNELTITLVCTLTRMGMVCLTCRRGSTGLSITVLPKALGARFSLNLLPLDGATQSLSGRLSSSLISGRTPTYSLSSEPVNSTVVLNDTSTGEFKYSTTATDGGTDSFTSPSMME